MKQAISAILFLCLASGILQAQELTQTFRGKILHRLTGAALTGASVTVSGQSVADITSISDEKGAFLFQIPPGRYKVTVSFTGFETFVDEVLMVAGRETILNIALQESSTMLQAIEVGSSSAESLPGLQTVSIEKTLRVPANFFDPVRMITSYPAVVAANDQNNAIIIRGNSPNGLLWRLNGLDIVNPNHLANAGTLSDRPAANGGGVNILSAQMLDRTDFYMGAVPASYGNVLSGVVDMKLRDGNKRDHEFTAQASVIGLDFAAEGPLGKSENNSFVANYRYSTVGLLSAAGVNFGDEAITFQDFSFNTSFDQKNGGTFSLFGVWGLSKNSFDAKKPEEVEVDKDLYNIDYSSNMYALGGNYSLPLSHGRFSAGLAYSGLDQQRNGLQVVFLPELEFQRMPMVDDYESENKVLSGSLQYELKVGAQSTVTAGTMVNYLDNSIYIYRRINCFVCGSSTEQRMDRSSGDVLFQPYLNFTTSLTPILDVNAGVRYLNYTFNNTHSIEPRAGIAVKTSSVSELEVSYSLISQLQLPQVYFAPENDDLGFTKSHHADIHYRQAVSNTLTVNGGVFYQSLFDVPIETSLTSTYSVLNLMDAIPLGSLVNEGSGENYGADITAEKYFFGKNYMLLGAGYYESKYTAADGVKRNTRFNGNYTLNAVYGKEWTKTSKNRTIGLNTRLLYLGGLRESAVDVAESESRGESQYNFTDPFSNKLPDYLRVDLRLSFRKNKRGYTRTFAVDIQNLTSQQNEAYHYYDFYQRKVVTKYQLGIIPVLVYRIDF